MLYLTSLFIICVLALGVDCALARQNDVFSNKEQRKINFITVTLIALVAGLRNVGGTDYVIYKAIYTYTPKIVEFIQNYANFYDKYFVFGTERGFLLINSIFKTIGFSYNGYIFCYSFITIYILYFATREYTKNYSIVILIFLYKMFFYDYFVSMRQTITITLFMVMIKYIEKRDWKKYFLLCIVCFFIHTASIILVAVYFIGRLKLSQKKLLILNVIFIPTLVLSYINLPVMKLLEPILKLDIFSSAEIFNKANNLISLGGTESISWLHTAEYFAMMVLTIQFYDDIVNQNPHAEVIIKIFICLLPIFTLFRNYEMLTRVKDYFTISYGFILSYFCYIRKGRYRFAAVMLVIMWCTYGYFRYINVFDYGTLKEYMPIIFDENISFFLN